MKLKKILTEEFLEVFLAGILLTNAGVIFLIAGIVNIAKNALFIGVTFTILGGAAFIAGAVCLLYIMKRIRRRKRLISAGHSVTAAVVDLTATGKYVSG